MDNPYLVSLALVVDLVLLAGVAVEPLALALPLPACIACALAFLMAIFFILASRAADMSFAIVWFPEVCASIECKRLVTLSRVR